MLEKFAIQRIGVQFTDFNGLRRWPPIAVARIGSARIKVDPMRMFAILSLSAVLVGTILGIWWFWTVGLTWFDGALIVACTFLVGLGTTLGYHRLFAHRAFQAKPWIVATLGILGAFAMQGQILTWTSVHRLHHHHSDTGKDPHTPRSMGAGLKEATASFIDGHVGWMVTGRLCTYVDYVRDLRDDKVIQWVDRRYWLWVALGWLVPGAIGALWYGGMTGFWSGFFAGGAIRAFVHLNSTSLVNSLGHLSGRRPFVNKDDSANNAFVNALSMNGEGLHNNHHAIPWSARLAMFRGEVDVGFMVLKGLERCGLVWNLKVPSAQYIAARVAPGQAAGLQPLAAD